MCTQKQGQSSAQTPAAEDGTQISTSSMVEATAGTNAASSTATRRSFEIIQAAAAAAAAAAAGSTNPRAAPIIQMNHRQSFPFIVMAIVVLNVGMLVFTMYENNCPMNATMSAAAGGCSLSFLRRFSFQPLSENPLLGPSASTLLKLGSMEARLAAHSSQGWRLLSSMWLHAGLFHLFVTMLGLLSIGIRLELAFGFAKIAAIYVLAGFGGGLVSALFIEQGAISVGASGALFGLLGSMVSEFIMNWSVYANKFLHLSKLVFLVIINFGFGFMPFVDNFAHIGGALCGFLLGMVLLARPRVPWIERCSYIIPTSYVPYAHQHMQVLQQQQPTWKHTRKLLQNVVRLAAINLLIAFYAASSILVFKGFDAASKCHICGYLSCVSTSFWTCPSTKAVALF